MGNKINLYVDHISQNGKSAWTGSVAYHENGKTAWTGSLAYHDNGKTAWTGSIAYHANGKTAWTGSTAYHDNGNSAGNEGIEIELGPGIRISVGKSGFKMFILGNCVVSK